MAHSPGLERRVGAFPVLEQTAVAQIDTAPTLRRHLLGQTKRVRSARGTRPHGLSGLLRSFCALVAHDATVRGSRLRNMATRYERKQHKTSLVTSSTVQIDPVAPSTFETPTQRRPAALKLGQSTAKLLSQVTELRSRLNSWRASFSIGLVYATIFLDFIGVTLLTPGMRFLVDPTHPGAFDDYRCPAPSASANATSEASRCAAAHTMAPGAAVSLMMFTFGLGQLISTPLMGWASDKWGKRRILLISTAGTAAGFLLQGFAWSFWPHAAMRFVGGLFSGSRYARAMRRARRRESVRGGARTRHTGGGW